MENYQLYQNISNTVNYLQTICISLNRDLMEYTCTIEVAKMMIVSPIVSLTIS